MATATVVATLVAGIPLGRLADRIGRKRVIFLLAPLWYASLLVLAFSPGPVALVLSSVLLVAYTISTGATNAMTMEVVPLSEQGRWGGLLGLFVGLASIPAPLIGGYVWKTIGPMYVFLIPIAFDLLFRIPLLATVSETLDRDQPLPQDTGSA